MRAATMKGQHRLVDVRDGKELEVIFEIESFEIVHEQTMYDVPGFERVLIHPLAPGRIKISGRVVRERITAAKRRK
jgi:hypothetical protein